MDLTDVFSLDTRDDFCPKRQRGRPRKYSSNAERVKHWRQNRANQESYRERHREEMRRFRAKVAQGHQVRTAPVTDNQQKRSKAKVSNLQEYQDSEFVETYRTLCSKKDDHQRKIFTYSKKNPSCYKISTVDEHSTFVSSFKVKPKEDAELLFDDDDVDSPPSPLKLQQECHQAVQPLSWLIGCWKSITACASYPDMKTVPYREEMQFFSTTQEVLQYNSETRHAETDKMMHCESGFLHVDPTSKAVAFVVTHSFGVSELSEGTLCDKTMLTLTSKSIARMSFTTNASLTEIVRCFELKGDILTSEVSIATVSQPLQVHLIVKYEKVF